MKINLIAAVGKRGQIGRDGGLPWKAKEDLAWFKQQTMGAVVFMGYRTFVSCPDLPGRMMIGAPRGEDEEVIIGLKRLAFDRQIWLAGGAATYRRFAPYVDGLRLISVIDYDSDPSEDYRHVFFPFDAYGMKWE